MIAVYDYEAQGDQELSLVEGDIVTLIAKEDEMWWCGQVRGQVGMFPSTYVEPYEDQGSIVWQCNTQHHSFHLLKTAILIALGYLF